MGDLTWLWIVLGIVVAALVIWWIWAYNKLVRLMNDIEEAASTIEVYQKKRFDLIPNLVNTVKGYTKHETDVIEDVTKMRAEVAAASSPSQRTASETKLGHALDRLFAVAEGYPDLKANTNFLDLQSQLGQIENEIAMSRRYYNGTVKLLNTMIQQWPTKYIANRLGYTKQPLYEVSDPAELRNVKVDFNEQR